MEAPGTLNTFKHSAYPVSTNLEANFRLESPANKTQGKAIINFLDGIFDFRFWDITEGGWMRTVLYDNQIANYTQLTMNYTFK